MRDAGGALLKLLVLAVAGYVWVFYLRIGWLLPATWIGGCCVAVYVTGRERSRLWRSSRVPGVVAVLVAYTALQLGVFGAATTQTPYVVPMRWTASGSEVALEFAEFPGHFLAMRSEQLAAHLASLGSEEIEAEFVVSRALGCMRGYRVVHVGGLGDFERRGDRARAAADTPGPWPDPFWCP